MAGPEPERRTDPRRFDLNPPDWILRLVKLNPGPTPWADVVRMAVTVPVPLAVAILAGAVPLGVYAAMGSMVTALADRGGPIRMRLFRELGTALAAAVGLFAGQRAHGTGWPAVLVIAAAALASALLSVLNAATSMAGLQLLVYTAIGSGMTLKVPLPWYVLPAAVLAGGAWAVLLSTAQALRSGARAPEREAVADVYRRCADLLTATGGTGVGDARQNLTAALDAAYDALLAIRSRSAGRRPVFRRLTALLNAATGVVEPCVAIAHRGTPPPPEATAAVTALADAISAGTAPPDLPAALRDADSPRLRALRTGLRDVAEQLRAEHPADRPAIQPKSARQRLVGIRDRVLFGPSTWLFALRLVLCMSLAEVTRGLLPLDRSYWVLLTVAIVLKPDFGSVFARAVQRGAGTLVGVLLGAGLVAVMPAGPWLVPLIGVAAGLLPIAMRRNFGMMAVFLTPLVVLLLDFGGQPHIVLARLLDTLTGCGLVLVFGYLLWPETWRVHLGPRVAGSVDRIGDYLRVAFEPDDVARDQRRRQTYRSLSEVRTAFQQKLAEPPPVSSRAAAWWPLIVQLEQSADAVTEAAIRVRNGAAPPRRDSVNLLVADVRELATALRERRDPQDLPLPEDDALAGVVTDVRAARRIAAAPGEHDSDLGQV